MEWRSPGGNLIQFKDSGEAIVNGTSVTLSPLIPGTNYLIKVSALTLQGQGQEMQTSGDVLNRRQLGRLNLPVDICVYETFFFFLNYIIYAESLAYFQLRLSPIVNCHNYLVSMQ